MTATVPDEVAERLQSEPLPAYLATSQDDRPHVAPVWYRYEDDVVEIMTTGRKLANIRANPRVSIAVQKHEAGVPEWVVTLLGTARVIEDDAENRAVNRQINRKYGADEDDWSENTLVRIDVGSVSYTSY
jgi:nitroimidazol reductase NimA-like FMN-containing flavoprotein (pyridoxamine 5'-phosphate oxidase superfamily)